MHTKTINFALTSELHAKLLFRQYQDSGDWICVMSPEFMEDLQELLDSNIHDLVQ